MMTARTRSGWKTTTGGLYGACREMPECAAVQLAQRPPAGRDANLPRSPLAARSGMCRAAAGLAGGRVRAGPAGDVTVADLGCLEGGYAAEFARAGYDVTGFEARQENHDAPYGWGHSWAWITSGSSWATPGRRCPACNSTRCSAAGLLYHLDQPVAFLNLLGEVTRRLLILNTNFSLEDGGHPETPTIHGERCDYADSR